MIDLYKLTRVLKKNRIYFKIKTIRDDYIMICVSVPGERWEIEIKEDGISEIEIFKSDGEIFGEEKLKELFGKFSD